jgi:transcriptional regulator with XRE-family HTH domain
MRKPAEVVPSGWTDYFAHWTAERGYSSADLVRITGMGDATVSRIRRGQGQPDVESCRKLARAWKRPMLEVLVASGHLEPAEARMRKPQLPPEPSPAEARIRRLTGYLETLPKADPKRRLLESLLDAGEIIAETRQRDVG